MIQTVVTGGPHRREPGRVELAIALLRSSIPRTTDRVGRRSSGLRVEAPHRAQRPLSHAPHQGRHLRLPQAERGPHDQFGAGHAGTAVSAALGMATARDLMALDYKVVAVVGDGALTCGSPTKG
jgi:1-deoxy-D-xylulose-5-phosphate synthase